MAVVIIGPPGAGKGVQSELIATRCGFKKIVIGDLLRDRALYDNTLKEILKKGELVNDNIIKQILIDYKTKNKLAFNNKLVIDGAPRNVHQAVLLDDIFDIKLALYLEIKNVNIIYDRILGRLYCPKCHRFYHIKYNKPKFDRICDFCSTKLIVRQDDKIDVLNKRIELFENESKLMLDFYSRTSRLKVIDAGLNFESVFNKVHKAIKRVYDCKN